MSEKKSLLLGALLGGIAAGATMYVLKTENGQAMKKLAQEKMSNLKIRAQEYMEEQGYSQEDIQNKITHFITQTNKQIFPQKRMHLFLFILNPIQKCSRNFYRFKKN